MHPDFLLIKSHITETAVIASQMRLFAKLLGFSQVCQRQTFPRLSDQVEVWNAHLTLRSWTSKLSLRVEELGGLFKAVTLCRATPRLSWLLLTVVGRGRHAWLWSQASSQAASSTSGLPSLLCRPHCHHCRAEDAAMGASPPPEPPPPAGRGGAGAEQLDRPGHLVSRREGSWGGRVGEARGGRGGRVRGWSQLSGSGSHGRG